MDYHFQLRPGSVLRQARAADAASVEPNDAFPIPYTTGVALFPSLAAAAMAIVGMIASRFGSLQSSGERESAEVTTRLLAKRRKLLCLTLLGLSSSTSILAYASSKFGAYEIIYPNSPYISAGVIGFFFAPFIMFFSISGLVQISNPTSARFILATSCLIVPGLVLLTMYCSFMTFTEGYAYYGPMRIVGYRVQQKTVEDRDPFSSTTYYYGNLRVGWGMDWGCPHYAGKWCESYIQIQECTYCSTSTGEYVSTSCTNGIYGEEEDAERCVRSRYDLYRWEDVLGGNFSDFDRAAVPEEGSDRWPVGVFYGDCSSCTAREPGFHAAMVGYAKKLKLAGAVLSTLGAAACFVLFVMALRKRSSTPVSDNIVLNSVQT